MRTSIGITVVVIFAIVYFILGNQGRFGDQTSEWEPYCEAPVGGLIQQPAAFWSDVGFILVGLTILLYSDIFRHDRNKLMANGPIAVECVLSLVGI